MKYPHGYIPEIGAQFNSWTIIDNTIIMLGKEPRRSRAVTCRCKCGKEFEVRILSLTSGKSKGCKCLAGEYKKAAAKLSGIGNLSKTQFYYYQHCANRRDISWEIDMQYLWDLLESQGHKCKLSAIPLRLDLQVGPHNTASVDRIDSKLPYVKGNIQWVHKDINKIKSDLDNDYFISLCTQVANNQ